MGEVAIEPNRVPRAPDPELISATVGRILDAFISVRLKVTMGEASSIVCHGPIHFGEIAGPC
jgi:hypothetical protein